MIRDFTVRCPTIYERAVMSNDFSKLSASPSSFVDQAPSLIADRRLRERTPALQEGTHIWLTGTKRVAVEVVDESAGGIGIVIPDASFNLGPRVDVEYQGRRRPAIVAYLKKNDDGQYRLGLEWVSQRDS
jgi:hypothetical protein